MARRPARRSPEASHEDILEAARICFTEHGYHLTKVDDTVAEDELDEIISTKASRGRRSR